MSIIFSNFAEKYKTMSTEDRAKKFSEKYGIDVLAMDIPSFAFNGRQECYNLDILPKIEEIIRKKWKNTI